MQFLPAVKSGDTFEFIVSLMGANGLPIVGATNFLKADIRNEKDVKIDSFVIVETDTEGEYILSAEDTSDWPIGVYLYMDIQYLTEELVYSSETIRILIAKDVTK